MVEVRSRSCELSWAPGGMPLGTSASLGGSPSGSAKKFSRMGDCDSVPADGTPGQSATGLRRVAGVESSGCTRSPTDHAAGESFGRQWAELETRTLAGDCNPQATLKASARRQASGLKSSGSELAWSVQAIPDRGVPEGMVWPASSCSRVDMLPDPGWELGRVEVGLLCGWPLIAEPRAELMPRWADGRLL